MAGSLLPDTHRFEEKPIREYPYPMLDPIRPHGLDGTSWIKNREIGDAVGEFFYGADQNPLRDSTILLPKCG
jgi:hypothetical protein